MNRAEIERALEDVFDEGILFHAFADYMRDYDVFIQSSPGPRIGASPIHLRYRFTHCVQVSATTAVPPDVWARSLDERLTEHAAAVESGLDGFIWGMKWQELYPGMKLVETSPTADIWSAHLGMPFHEVHVRTNAHNLRLVFSDLVVTTIEPGHTPFVVPALEPDTKPSLT